MVSPRLFSIAMTLLLCCIAAPQQVNGAIMAVDLGSEFLKISVIQAGRTPISIVNNEMSKRKTTAAVALIDGDRLVGEEAAALQPRFPDKVFLRLRDLLGRSHDDPALLALLKETHLPYEIVPASSNRSAAAVKTDTGDAYTGEELVASLLEYAKSLASVAADGAAIADCVLVVPAFFGPAQRQALLDAAKLAGLNVMGLIHPHAAAALQYGIERDFTNKTEDVVFYDLGSGDVQVALVRFSSYETPQGAVSQFEVRDYAWVERAGGAELEVALMRHFANEFHSKNGGGDDKNNPLNVPRAAAKLRKQVKRTKEVLSANSEAQISVEDLLPGFDFRSSISREEFEGLAHGIWSKAVSPVMELLKRNNMTADDVSAFELVGGGSRVPRVKSELSEALGGRALDMHLDADEAIVLGAGYFAANLSTIFRLRKFGMTDRLPYSVMFTLEGAGEDSVETDGTTLKERILAPAMKKMPTKRAISFTSPPDNGDSFKVGLEWDNAPGAVMPCCHRRGHLGDFEVSGLKEVLEKYNSTEKIALHTRIDANGVFVIDGADAAVEIEEEVVIVEPSTTVNGTTTEEAAAASSNSTDSSNSTTTAEAAATIKEEEKEAAPAPPVKTEMRRRSIKAPLNITGSLVHPGLTRQEYLASRDKLRALKFRDEEKKATAKARNDLEAYIINMRGKLEDDETLIEASTEAERDGIKTKMMDTEDWLYGDGEKATTEELRDKLDQIRRPCQAIQLRAEEKANRPTAVELAKSFITSSREKAASWPEKKPWIQPTEIEGVVAKINEVETWLNKRVTEQEQLKDHEDPAFTAMELFKEVEKAKKAVDKLDAKRQPRPPPAPKNETVSGNSTTTNSTDTDPKKEEEASHDEL